jgi:hypothetical protein
MSVAVALEMRASVAVALEMRASVAVALEMRASVAVALESDRWGCHSRAQVALSWGMATLDSGRRGARFRGDPRKVDNIPLACG